MEYAQLFGITFFHIEECAELQKNGYGGNYIDFLFEYYHDSFFVRLASCAVCLSFWLGLLSCLFLGISGFLVMPLTLFFYLIFNKLL